MRLFVDQLTNVDFSYLCPSRGLVGETWLANIELEGKLDEQGMVCDFGIVKKICRDWLDQVIDHCLLVPTQNDRIKISEDSQSVRAEYRSDLGLITCQAPPSALTQIPSTTISKASVASWCIEQLQGKFGPMVAGIKLCFQEESIGGPYYHYSHGLKKHLGNCQRIAHGHRSKILIWRNGQQDDELMSSWAKRWQDIYIATRSDLKSTDASHYHFAYTAQQGPFILSMPQNSCYLIDSDSTVEHLAQHIADTIAVQTGDHIEVKAFEGLAKGAIATAP